MRGTLLNHHHADGDRFIPACAGNTPPHWKGYPRFIPAVRGSGACRSRFVGSSPPVRGTLHSRLTSHSACTTSGSSPPVRGTQKHPPHRDPLPQTVHPRLCGEHLCGRLGGYMTDFIPPVRGTRGGKGKCHTVHPRLCGEHRSPCERGCNSLSGRFIPACAGNTRRPCSGGITISTVHPRLCGEHYCEHLALLGLADPRLCGEHSDIMGDNWGTGSSPPVRGTQLRSETRGRRSGSSPVRGTLRGFLGIKY